MCSSCFLPCLMVVLFLLSALPDGGALPALLCSARPLFLLDGGSYPFLTKITFSFLPPKIPANFSKTSPYTYTFNTTLTYI